MAATLKLVRREDTKATGYDVSSISLLDNTNGFNLDYASGWTPAVASGMRPGNLQEVITLISKGTSHDNLAARRQALDDKLKEAEWYWDDPTERYGVWLRAQLENETYMRQALVRRGNAQWGDSPYGPFVDEGLTDRSCMLGLERLPWWEGTVFYTYHAYDVEFGGDTANHTAIVDVAGDVPARIGTTQITVDNTDLEEAWFGFRTNRFGDRTNFQVKWECDDGTVYANTGTTEQTDYMECDFSTGNPNGEAMQSRFYVKVEDVTTDYSDQRGQFIVLLRAQVSDGTTTTRVRLLDGYSSTADNLRRQDRVTVDDSNWRLYPLGTIQIPPLSGLTSYNMLRPYRLCLQAERTSGSGDLRCDNFVLIPISEGALYVSGLSITTFSHEVKIVARPDGTINGWTLNGNNILKSVIVRPQGPYGYTLPVGSGLTVFAGQGATSHTPTNEANLSFSRTAHRWRTLRGSDVPS